MGVLLLYVGIMEMPNPKPPNVLPKRKRTPFIKTEELTPKQKQELQDQKQAEHGRMVALALKAQVAAQAKSQRMLTRGQPTVRDEMNEAVMARMGPQDIPTKGNTDT
jgi:hypothetical protein